MIEKFEDVRLTKWHDKGIIETPSEEILATLSFNQATKWTGF